MNTAALTEAFEKGLLSAAPDTEVKRYRLYELNYKGCVSCLACKLKGRSSKVCLYRDGLSEALREASEADGLVLASPIYMGEFTGQMRAFCERLVFPWLSYNDFSCTAPKRKPVAFIYTMNAPEEYAGKILQNLAFAESVIAGPLGKAEHVIACNTVQVRDYGRYEMQAYADGSKLRYREAHWDEDLRKANEAGRRMAEAMAEGAF